MPAATFWSSSSTPSVVRGGRCRARATATLASKSAASRSGPSVCNAGWLGAKAARSTSTVGTRQTMAAWLSPMLARLARAALASLTLSGACRNIRPYIPRCTCRRASPTSMNRCLPCASAFATTAPASRRYSTPRAHTAAAFCPTSRACRLAACLWMVSPSGIPASLPVGGLPARRPARRRLRGARPRRRARIQHQRVRLHAAPRLAQRRRRLALQRRLPVHVLDLQRAPPQPVAQRLDGQPQRLRVVGEDPPPVAAPLDVNDWRALHH